MSRRLRFIVGAAVLLASLRLPFCLQVQSLREVAAIDLPGPKGQRFDYLTRDDEDHYLLSAHLGPGLLYVIDVQTNKVIKTIPGVPGITGLECVPGMRKIYTSNWGEKKIGVVNLHSMSVIKRLPTAAKANGSVYAPPFRKVYVADTLGNAVAVVDVEKDEIVKTLKFNSEAGMPQYDSVARRIYVNLRVPMRWLKSIQRLTRSPESTRSGDASTTTAWPLIRNTIGPSSFAAGAGR